MDPLISITGVICSLTGYTSAFSKCLSKYSCRKAKNNQARCGETRRPFIVRGVLKLGRSAGVRTAQSKQKSFTEGGEQLKSV